MFVANKRGKRGNYQTHLCKQYIVETEPVKKSVLSQLRNILDPKHNVILYFTVLFIVNIYHGCEK